MPYIPVTEENRKAMLETIGVSDFDELLAAIPAQARFDGKLDLPKPLSELEITTLIKKMGAKNEHAGSHVCFLGGGAYDHFVPAAIDHILLRPEFYTAYTPYQPEVSQGNLQAIYEYQTMIANITEMDVANASMYDGATAMAEAALMAHAQTRRPDILIAKSVHPYYRRVVDTYCNRSGINVVEIDIEGGIINIDHLKKIINNQTAAVLLQHPNFFGSLEEVEKIEAVVHEAGALYVVSVDPISLGVLAPPGSYNADIATGEGQALGNGLNFGGPYIGIFTVNKKLVRRMPGRLAGVTVDKQGKRGFVLTLQTREQHIRRDKATSAICTNEQLCALASTVYLALMGKQGLPTVAQYSMQKAHYLADKLTELDGVEMLYNRPFFKEFAIKTSLDPQIIIDKMRKFKIFAGINLNRFDYGKDNGLLIAVTEKRTREELDQYIDIIKEILA